MMALGLSLKEITAAFAAVGTIGGGALTLNALHDPAGAAKQVKEEITAEYDDRFSKVDARMTGYDVQGHVTAIQNWIRVAREEGPSPSTCDAIEAELAELCQEAPKHYLCTDKSREDLRRRAGCQ